MSDILFVIQARLGSTRLPGKVLMPMINGKTLLENVINRVKRSKYFDSNIVIATTTNPIDDEIVYMRDILTADIKFIRGSEENVLNRFIKSLNNEIRYVVRICSDNPFIDMNLVDSAISFIKKNPEIEYVSHSINNQPAILTHYGFFAEVVTSEALLKISAISTEKEDFEHVTKGIYSRRELFNCHFIDVTPFFVDKDFIRTTVDTIEDFSVANSIIAHHPNSEGLPFQDIIDFLDTNSSLREFMSEQISKNTK